MQAEAASLLGVCERMFRTHQEHLPRELALAGITDMEQANRYLATVYRDAFNAEIRRWKNRAPSSTVSAARWTTFYSSASSIR